MSLATDRNQSRNKMSDLTTKLNWNGGLKFIGVNRKGMETAFDGNTEAAASPMEILLESLGACTAIDVVLILEKQRTPLEKFEISLEADRHSPEPRYYTAVRVKFDLWGDNLQIDKVARAIALSVEKYCSVFHSLRKDMQLQPEFRIHPPTAAAAGEYQAVTFHLGE
jgi:putative redox protein